MGKVKIWFMDARANRFLESTAIKGRQILDHSGWLDNLKPGDIVAVKTHMGEAYNVGYLRPVIIRTSVEALKESNGNMARAAASLGTTERVMGLRVRKYHLNAKGFRSAGKLPSRNRRHAQWR